MKEILQEVLARIKPTESHKKLVEEVTTQLRRQIAEELLREGIDNVKIELVGSVAKDTYLTDDVDIDFFLLYPTNFDIKHITKTTLKIGKRILDNYTENYAQHPYARGTYMGFNVDIVPSYNITDSQYLKTPVDRTPFHTRYVKEHLREDQKDEVRLLKAFMKGLGVYGAESRVGGFAGYVCELLVIKYGSFINVLREATKWRRGIVLNLLEGDIELHNMDTSKPMIFIDPVDPKRNAAAAIKEESFYMFILGSKCFLENPSINYFFPRREFGNVDKLTKFCEDSELKIYLIELIRPAIVEEILHSQLQKFCKVVKDILRENKFIPRDVFYIVRKNKVYIVFTIERDTLPKAKLHKGPPVYSDKVLPFIEKWKNRALTGPYISKNRLYVLTLREKNHVREILAEEINNRDIGKNLNSLKSEIRILSLNEVIDRLDEDTIAEIYEKLVKRLPWTI